MPLPRVLQAGFVCGLGLSVLGPALAYDLFEPMWAFLWIGLAILVAGSVAGFALARQRPAVRAEELLSAARLNAIGFFVVVALYGLVFFL